MSLPDHAGFTATAKLIVERPDRGRYLLTQREYEIARLAGEGRTDKKTAESLGIAPATVNAHLKRIFSKLRIHNRSKLAALAASWGPGEWRAQCAPRT